jgi:hypothetical protein
VPYSSRFCQTTPSLPCGWHYAVPDIQPAEAHKETLLKELQISRILTCVSLRLITVPLQTEIPTFV